MRYEVRNRPSNATLNVRLDEGEWVGTQGGKMLSRSDAIEVENRSERTDGGSSLLKQALDGEDSTSTSRRRYESPVVGSQLTLSPPESHDVVAVDLSEKGRVLAQREAFFAWTPRVDRSMASSEVADSLSDDREVLELGGGGTAFLTASGAICERQVTRSDPLVVATDQLVGWSANLEFTPPEMMGITSSVLNGESYVGRFKGEGSAWVHTPSETED